MFHVLPFFSNMETAADPLLSMFEHTVCERIITSTSTHFPFLFSFRFILFGLRWFEVSFLLFSLLHKQTKT